MFYFVSCINIIFNKLRNPYTLFFITYYYFMQLINETEKSPSTVVERNVFKVCDSTWVPTPLMLRSSSIHGENRVGAEQLSKSVSILQFSP